jgi:hypothetical protein
MNNEALKALVDLQLLDIYVDFKGWAWASTITACIALIVFIASESKFWIWLSSVAAVCSIYFFWKLSGITHILASRGIYL